MKKFLSKIIILLSCLSLIAGCSNKDVESNASSSTSTTQSTSAPVQDSNKAIPDSFDITEGNDKIILTTKYNKGFTIEEEFRFDELNHLKAVRTYVKTKGCTLLEVSDTTKGIIDVTLCEEVSQNKYIYDHEGSVYLEGVMNEKYDSVLSKLKRLCNSFKKKTTSSNNTSKASSLLILDYSEKTLTLDKTSMRIGIGETCQIAISKCPKEYIEDIIFVSSNPNFAKVDAYGNVTGVASGVTTINVSIHGAAVYQSIVIYVA